MQRIYPKHPPSGQLDAFSSFIFFLPEEPLATKFLSQPVLPPAWSSLYLHLLYLADLCEENLFYTWKGVGFPRWELELWKSNIFVWDINGERPAIIGKIPKLIQLPAEAWTNAVQMSPKPLRAINLPQHKLQQASSVWGKGRHFQLPGKWTSLPCCILSRSQILVLSQPAGILTFVSPAKSWIWSHFLGDRFLKEIFKPQTLLPQGSGWQNQSFMYLINTLKTIFCGFLKHVYPAALDPIEITFWF